MISHHHLFHLVSTSASAISHLPVPVSAEEASSLDMAESLSGRVELYNTHLKWENIFPKAGKPYAIFRTAFERRSDCCRSRMVKARLLDMIGKLICIYCILYILYILYEICVFCFFLSNFWMMMCDMKVFLTTSQTVLPAGTGNGQIQDSWRTPCWLARGIHQKALLHSNIFSSKLWIDCEVPS